MRTRWILPAALLLVSIVLVAPSLVSTMGTPSKGLAPSNRNPATHLTPPVVIPRAPSTGASRSFVVGSVPVGNDPLGFAVNATSGTVYVVNSGSSTISILNGLSTVATISAVESSPTGLTFDPVTGLLYVTGGFPYVTVFRGETLVNYSLVEGLTSGGAYDSLTGEVEIVSFGTNMVSVFQGLTPVGTFQIPGVYSFGGMVFDPQDGWMYYANDNLDGTVLAMNGSTLMATIPVGTDPAQMTYDASNGNIYVMNTGSRNVSVIHGSSLVGTVSFGYVWSMMPSGATFDPLTGYVYVASSGTNNVSVVNGTAPINSVNVGEAPEGATFDPANGYVYVANSVSNNVSVINGSFYYPGVSAFTSRPSTVQLNSTTIATTRLMAAASPGEGVLSLAYSGLPPGCASANETPLPCTPTKVGFYTVIVYVNNSLGYGATTMAGLWVIAGLQDIPNVYPTTVRVGDNVTFTGAPSEGSGTYSVMWRFGDGTTSLVGDVLHAYSSAGTYTVRLWANDTNGGALNFSFRVSVLPKPAPGFPSLWPYLESPVVLGGIAAAALVIGVVNLVLLSRRKRTPPLPPARSEEAPTESSPTPDPGPTDRPP